MTAKYHPNARPMNTIKYYNNEANEAKFAKEKEEAEKAYKTAHAVLDNAMSAILAKYCRK